MVFKILLIVYRIVLSLSIITGMIKLKSFKEGYFKALPFYLMIIFVLDNFNVEISNFFDIGAMSYYSKFVIPFQFLFFSWFYFMYFKEQKLQRILPLIGTIVLSCILLKNIFINKEEISRLDTTSYLIGGLFMLGYVLIYLYNILFSDRILTFFQERFFYISLGLITFYIVSLPYYGFFNFIQKNNDLASIFSYVVNVCNILMYVLFGISFIWGKRI